MTAEPALEVEGLSARYGAITALSDVSIQVAEGELVAVIGTNGAGKSTLLRVISGVHRASSGRIVIRGKDANRASTHALVRLGLVHVPEGRALFPQMTVKENLDLGVQTRRCSPEALQRIWALFPPLYERRKQRAASLSGGEQQMLALARGLVAEPHILLLDEPSLGLAPRVAGQLMNLLRELNEEGLTIVLVEQNATAALQIADRAYVLETGRVALAGAAADLLHDPKVQRTYLGLGIDH